MCLFLPFFAVLSLQTQLSFTFTLFKVLLNYLSTYFYFIPICLFLIFAYLAFIALLLFFSVFPSYYKFSFSFSLALFIQITLSFFQLFF